MSASTRLQFVTYLCPAFPVELFEHMAQIIDADLHVVETTSGPDPADDPFAAETYDIGWMCSTGFAPLVNSDSPPSARLTGITWIPEHEPLDQPVYYSDLVVAPTARYTSLNDLAGRRIACGDRSSLSGFHALRMAVEHRGGDVDSFGQLIFTGGHLRSLPEVVAGRVDAAVVDSVVLARHRTLDPDIGALSVIERLGPWPTQPLVAGIHVEPATVEQITSVLLDANDDPSFQRMLRRAGLRGLVAVGADHWDPVVRALTDGATPES